MSDSLGLDAGVVRLVEYDPEWPAVFAAEACRVLLHAGDLPLRLEHVGGTSIPGMCSKPILDIAAGRLPGSSIDEYIAVLERAGYDHRGERGVPGREFFSRGRPRAYHLHLVEEGEALWCQYIAFRDYLRAHPEGARRFADVKRRLAARFGKDRDGYLSGKSPYVLEILRMATDLEC